jgi:hypothetical protein
MLFLQISKHSPESCPMNNEKAMKVTSDLFPKLEKLTKKHGIKMVGGWHDGANHRVIIVWDGSFEALMKLSMEPEFLTWGALHNTETCPVMTLEESAKFFLK